MEEIEKINIINKRLRQKEARADWKWVNDGKQFGWARGRSKNRKSKRGYEVGTKESRKLERKWFKNIYHKILFHIPLTEEEWYGNSHKVFQISEEDFNKVVEKYNEMVKVAKEIKAT